MSFPTNLPDDETTSYSSFPYNAILEKRRDPYLTPGKIALHLLLFLATVFTTLIAGVQWLNHSPFDLTYLPIGLPYAISLLSILTAHEFGHYFAAKHHGVRSTLPFYIPVPSFLLNPFGTMGAVIRIRSQIPSRKVLFDIGIAGPLAGLVVTLCVLAYGIATLPGKEFLYNIHPEYRELATIPTYGLTFGNSLFFWSLSKFVSAYKFFPPMNEIYHYPFLCAAWFGFFITALNLIPVGQLDGGHVLYSLVGRKQGTVARIFLLSLLIASFRGFISQWNFEGIWNMETLSHLIWISILFFIFKPDHPPISDEEPLDESRRLLGWTTFAIFIITFIPIPFSDIAPF